MIYGSKARACEVAFELNQRRGFGESRAVLTAEGWTVITSQVWPRN